jgi:SAM-dependent methyltransferase
VKHRLVAGTINHWPESEDGWRTWTLDVSDRGIWDRELNMSVRPHFVMSVADLADFRADTFDEIRCHHVLEHVRLDEAEQAVRGFWRILKPGGILDVETPDVLRVIDAWNRDELDLAGLNQWLYGEHLANHEAGDTHKTGWSKGSLWNLLAAAGFELVEQPDAGYAVRYVVTKADA